MSTVRKFEELKARIEEAKNKIAKAEGAIEQMKIVLKSKHGCATLEQAERKIGRMAKNREALIRERDDVMESILAKCPEELRGP